MTRYRIFEPAGTSGASVGAVFVKDAFAPLGFLFTFVWLFVQRLWLWGLAAALAIGLAAFLDTLPGFGLAGAIVPLCVGLLVALEGPSLRAARLSRRGFREVAAVQATSLAEAEIVYYAEAGEVVATPARGDPLTAASSPARGLAPGRLRAARRGDGLFAAPQTR